jgi:hypothetical protein
MLIFSSPSFGRGKKPNTDAKIVTIIDAADNNNKASPESAP